MNEYEKVRRALALVREARDLLRAAGAVKAAERVAGVVHSVEGAERHAGLSDVRKRRQAVVATRQAASLLGVPIVGVDHCVSVEESPWTEAVSGDPTVLMGPTLWVSGTPMHLEAHAVHWSNGTQMPTGSSGFDELNRAFEVSHAQVEMEIRGKPYVLFAFAMGRT